MFLEFYGLQEHPFGVTPNPRYLYFSPTHREALASLFYGLETERGFLSLVAPPGAGKTTLLFQLLERLPQSTNTAFLFQTQCNTVQLLRYLAADLNLEPCEPDVVALHSRLNTFLLAQAQAGRRVVVVIDEAQNLCDETLETVRLLSDFETPDRKLLQVVLAGQPELAERLKRPGLEQLRQRIAVSSRLDPLPASEIVQYIDHRLRVAGRLGPSPFSSSALDVIVDRSAGIPRNINNLCFQALSLGFARGCRRIDRDVMQEVVGEPPSVEHSPRVSVAAERGGQRPHAATAALTFLAGGLFAAGVVAFSAAASSARLPASAVPPAPIPVSRAALALPPIRVPDVEPAMATHVVEPDESLRKISVRYVGHVDAAFMADILALNRDITDPDLVTVGQVIRLPPSTLGQRAVYETASDKHQP